MTYEQVQVCKYMYIYIFIIISIIIIPGIWRAIFAT